MSGNKLSFWCWYLITAKLNISKYYPIRPGRLKLWIWQELQQFLKLVLLACCCDDGLSKYLENGQTTWDKSHSHGHDRGLSSRVLQFLHWYGRKAATRAFTLKDICYPWSWLLLKLEFLSTELSTELSTNRQWWRQLCQNWETLLSSNVPCLTEARLVVGQLCIFCI